MGQKVIERPAGIGALLSEGGERLATVRYALMVVMNTIPVPGTHGSTSREEVDGHKEASGSFVVTDGTMITPGSYTLALDETDGRKLPIIVTSVSSNGITFRARGDFESRA